MLNQFKIYTIALLSTLPIYTASVEAKSAENQKCGPTITSYVTDYTKNPPTKEKLGEYKDYNCNEKLNNIEYIPTNPLKTYRKNNNNTVYTIQLGD